MDWRDIPSLAALRAFEAAARRGSFAEAARELNVTHAAIAQHVRAIEAQIGTPLMHRAGRKMALSEAGTHLANELSEGFSLVIAGVRDIAAGAASRPLNVTVTPGFAEYWLMPRMCNFWEEHPEITVSITPDNGVADLRRDGYDMAIRYGMGDWPGLNAEFLVSADFVIVAAPALIAGRDPQSIADLADLPWMFEKVHQVHRKWAIENGLNLAECQIKELATLSMVLAGVRAGAGVSVVSRALVADDILAGRLTAIHEVKRQGLGYYITTVPVAHNPKAAAFRKWLKKQS